MQALIEWPANVEAEGRFGWKPIHFAAMSGDCDTIRLLLNAGAKLAACDFFQNTCLHLAAMYGRVDAAELLVSLGIQMDACNLRNETPFHASARLGQIGVAKLLASKLKVDERLPGGSWRAPLYFAAQYGHADVVKVFLERGDGKPSSSLHAKSLYIAANNGHYDVVELLIRIADNKVSAARNLGRSLHGAAKGGQSDIIRLLVTNGANIEALDEGQTPFQAAVMGATRQSRWGTANEEFLRKQVDAARLLAELGADTKGYVITDTSIQDRDGKDVLQECIKNLRQREDTSPSDVGIVSRRLRS